MASRNIVIKNNTRSETTVFISYEGLITLVVHLCTFENFYICGQLSHFDYDGLTRRFTTFRLSGYINP